MTVDDLFHALGRALIAYRTYTPIILSIEGGCTVEIARHPLMSDDVWGEVCHLAYIVCHWRFVMHCDADAERFTAGPRLPRPSAGRLERHIKYLAAP